MTYCMSDIHGEIDRFHGMLKEIDLQSDDHLYIIGDVIDRYPDGVDILREIMSMKNATMLLGNHEDMCLKTFGESGDIYARNLWKNNGGSYTYRELVYCMSPQMRNEILKFLRSLQVEIDITVADRKFHLVHGWPGRDIDDKIWGRPMDCLPIELPSDTIAIIGHTPTPFLYSCDDGFPFHIIHDPGRHFIDIDCGCGNKTNRRVLACLRLDDMKEFYV